MLGGCSAVPEWANPVGWYDSVFGARGPAKPDQPSGGSRQDTAANSGSSAFPTLATPERPSAGTSGDRQAVKEGLLADRANARYTDDVARGRTDLAAADGAGLKPAGMLFFAGDSLQPDLQGQALLRQLADRQKLAGGIMRVVAYGAGVGRLPSGPQGGSQGTDAQSLPRQRGHIVAAELVRRGVNPQDIVVEGAPAAGTQASTVAIFIDN